MREIKFRAWDECKKVMLYEVQNAYDTIEPCFDSKGKQLDWYEDTSLCSRSFGSIIKDEIPLMQFTGLKDKNGKDIYEGDIVYIFGKNIKVRWEFGSWQVEGGGLLDGLVEYLYVVGNIYENPEMLNK